MKSSVTKNIHNIDMDQDSDTVEKERCLQALSLPETGEDSNDMGEAKCEALLEKEPKNFEDIVVAMGKPGRYQITQSLLMSLNVIPSVFINMNFVFIGVIPAFSCSPVNETFLEENSYQTNETTSYHVSYKECDVRIMSNISGTLEEVHTMTCSQGYSYTEGRHTSIMSEWDLVCDARGLAEMSQTVLSLGWFIGAMLASTLSDKYGRKKTFIVAALMSSVFEFSNAFSPNIYTMIALRFFSGLFGAGLGAVTYVLGIEFFVSSYREIFCIYIGVLWSAYSMLLCLIAYLLQDSGWRNFQICIAVCGMAPLIPMYFLDESTSWLFSKGKHKQATTILRKACRLNGLEFDKIRQSWDTLCSQEVNKRGNIKEAKDYNALDIFRNRTLRMSVIIAWAVCFTNDLSYFGMYLSASTLSGSLYVNTTLMALLEIPGCFLMLFMLKYLGRRAVINFFMMMCAVCLLISTCLGSVIETNTHHLADFSTAMFLLGRMAVSSSYATIYMYIPELFPTTLRSSGYGLCTTGGCLGGMVSPFLLPLHALVPWAPGTCLIVLLTISFILLLKLPETKGKQLASIIDDSS